MAELRQTMSNDEFFQWRAYHTWRNAMREFELEKAKAERG